MPPFTHIPLRLKVTQTLIVAYKENVQPLETSLEQEGLKGKVLRQVHQPGYQHYSRSYLALLNHCEAWKQASQVQGLTLVLEADFVPVKGMGMLPLPMHPEHPELGIAWLYTCAPQIYSVSEDGYAQGFSTAMVAYLITSASAIALLEMATHSHQSTDPFRYSAWDSNIGDFLRQRQLKTFIPLRNYGEHGGLPNPEHRKYGLSTTHRADVLYGPLSFMPMYAQIQNAQSQNAQPHNISPQSTQTTGTTTCIRPRSTISIWSHTIRCQWRFIRIRLYARIKGIGRLVLGKFLRGKVVRESSVPTWLLGFAIRRQLSWHL